MTQGREGFREPKARGTVPKGLDSRTSKWGTIKVNRKQESDDEGEQKGEEDEEDAMLVETLSGTISAAGPS